MKIVVVIGTNRKGSLSSRLGAIVAEQHRSLGAEVDVIELADVLSADFVSPSAYKEPSEAIIAATDRFIDSDGVVFIVPEYNGSYPGALKLFIDMLPYPAGFDNRPCAFVGLAAGQFASLRAVEHFQQVAGYRNAFQYPRRVLIAGSFQQFDENGLKDEDLVKRLETQSSGFQDYVSKVGGSQAKSR